MEQTRLVNNESSSVSSGVVDRVLIIKAKGGLGNRILSAVCGLVYADLTYRHPVVDWRDGSYAPIGENAYPLLFNTPITLRCEDFDNYKGPVSPMVWQGRLDLTPQAMIEEFEPDKHSSATVYRRFCTNLARIDSSDEVAVFWCYLPKFGRLAGHMRRDPRFRGRGLEDIISEYLNRYFVPNDRIKASVEEAMASLVRPIIGVHIRYTDRKIPLEKVKSALRDRLSRRPGATVFLATDNAAVQAEIQAEFQNVQVVQKYLPPDGSRLHWPGSDVTKLQEAENALIDMWLLAQSDELIYSRHSTFSITSSLIGRQSKSQLTDVDRRNLLVVIKRIMQNYL
jgi:hypothetical protein